jgi:hypothetical protein
VGGKMDARLANLKTILIKKEGLKNENNSGVPQSYRTPQVPCGQRERRNHSQTGT